MNTKAPDRDARPPPSAPLPGEPGRTRRTGWWLILLLAVFLLAIVGSRLFAYSHFRAAIRDQVNLTLAAITNQKRQQIESLLAHGGADDKVYGTGNALTPELTWDAARDLYPLVRPWPMPTRTGETFLVGREGGTVRYLSPVRDAEHATMAAPVTASGSSAALVAQGRTGILAGVRNARGEPVLAYATPIADRPWVLVSTIAESEAFAGFQATVRTTLLIVGIGLLGFCVGVLLLVRRYRQVQRLSTRLASWTAEERFRALVETTSDCIWETDARGRFNYLSPRFEDITGYDPAEFLGKGPLDLLDPEQPQARAALREGIAGHQAITGFEHAIRHRDGRQVLVEVNGVPVPGPHGVPLGMRGVTRDITERRRQAEALLAVRESAARHAGEQRLGALVEQGLAGIAEADLDGRFIRVNDRFCSIVGHPRETLIGEHPNSFSVPEDRSENQAIFDRLVDGAAPEIHERRFIRQDGGLSFAQVAVALVRDDAGQPAGFIGLVSDITAQKKTEAALRKAQERLTEAQKIAHLGSFEYEVATGRVVWSDEQYRIFGLDAAAPAPAHETLLQCIHPEDTEQVRTSFAAAVAGAAVFACEYRIMRPDGGMRWVADLAYPYCDTQGRLVRYVGTTLDITARRETEEEVRALNAGLERKVEERTAELVAAQAQLQETLERVARSEARFRTMVEEAPLGVALVESNSNQVEAHAGRIIEVNPSFAAIVGRPIEQLRGCDWMSLTHPDDVQAGLDLRARLTTMAPALPRTLKVAGAMVVPPPHASPRTGEGELERAPGATFTVRTGETKGLQMRKRYLRPDGSVVWADLTLVPVDAEAGEPPRHLCMIEDVTERKRLERALADSEERYRLALEAASDGLWDMDLVTGVLSVNDHWYVQLGYTPAEVVPTYGLWRSHLHPDDLVKVDRALGPCLSGVTRHYACDYRIITKAGAERWHQSVGQVVRRDAKRAALRMIGTTGDITDKVRTQSEINDGLQRLQLATRVAGLGIWSSDLNTRQLEWDERMCDLYELPLAQRSSGVTHDFWVSRVHPDDLRPVQTRLEEAIRSAVPFEEVFRICLPGERVRYIHAAAIVERTAGGSPRRLLGVNRDITAQREQEEALRTAKQDAEAASLAKTAFLAHMSHEIRTPMNTVLGLTQVLERTALDADQRAMVGQVRTAGRSLLSLLNDILDLSKIEAGRLALELRPFGLAALLADLDDLMGGTARGKGLAFNLSPPSGLDGALLGDPLRLEQVLVNLIGNAVKFTDQGEVRVRVEVQECTSERVRLRFEVSDTGIGIGPEALAGLFAPFTQADAGITRRFGGTGLGLAISKRLVEAMGGAIGVASTPGAGSTFWFELPFERSVQPQSPVSTSIADGAPRASRLSGLRVLVVDDSAMNRDLVERVLAMEGARTTPAADGREALAVLRTHPGAFDAVLMDVQMPVLDGLSATRAIRTELGLTALPVIACTAGVLQEQQEAAQAAGADAVLLKPLDLEQLRAMLGRWAGPAPTEPDAGSGTLAPARPDAAAFPEIPGIDPVRAGQSLKGNRSLFLRLLRSFSDEFSSTAEGVRLDLAAGDRTSALRRLHTLKGNAGTLGAVDLMALAAQLEEALKRGEVGLDGRLTDLGTRIAALIADSAPWRETAAGPASTAAVEPGRLQALREALESRDLAALADFEAVEPALLEALGETDTGALGQLIRGLRFDDAQALLDRVLPPDRVSGEG